MQKQDDEDFRFLAENSADMVCRVGFDLVMRYASPSCERLLGWKPEEMVGKGPDAFVCPDDLPRVAAAHERLMREGADPAPTEIRMRRRDGSYAWMEVNARVAHGEGEGEASAIVLVMRDVSRRKADEPGLRGVHSVGADNDNGLRKAFSMTPVPMLIATLTDFRIVDVNDAFVDAMGYAPDDVKGRRPSEIRLLDERACRHVGTMLSENDHLKKMEVRLRTAEGDVLDCMLSVATATLDAGPCVLVVFQNISERKRSESELMEAIESVMKDTSWFSQAVIEKLAQLRQPHRAARPEAELSDLTPREREVLGLVCEGQTDDDISVTLGLSRNTVRNHLSRIYTKIGVHRRAGAIVWARARGVMAYEPPKRRAKRA